MSIEVISHRGVVEVESSSSSIGIHTGIIGGSPYSGDYEITPSSEEQRLSTSGRIMSRDIVISAIPSNYGRIEWNGSLLRIS